VEKEVSIEHLILSGIWQWVILKQSVHRSKILLVEL